MTCLVEIQLGQPTGCLPYTCTETHKNSSQETSQSLSCFTLKRGAHIIWVSAWYTNDKAFVVSNLRCTTPLCWIERDALREDKQSK